jgi:hypothetical protein
LNVQHTHNTLSANIRAKSVELLNKHLAARSPALDCGVALGAEMIGGED